MISSPPHSVDLLRERLNDFERCEAAFRHAPPLTHAFYSKLLSESGGDAARARASLQARVGRQDPHARTIRGDAHITGHVGGTDRRVPSQIVWGGYAFPATDIRFNQPRTRPYKPANDRGQTSLHFSYECVTKIHLEHGRCTRGGRRANASSHADYIEREEAAAAAVDQSVYLNPGSHAQYLQRAGAVAAGGQDLEQSLAIVTNLPGSRDDRIAFFRAVANHEQVRRPPSVCVDFSQKTA